MSQSNSHSLSAREGVHAKLSRADEHLKTLAAEVRAFIDYPHRIVTEHNADFTEYQFRVKWKLQPDLVRWSLLAGDFMSNARSALDYLTYGLMVKWTGTDPPPDAHLIQFPIHRKRREFNHAIRSRLQDLPTEKVRTILDAAQPYNGGKSLGWLATLHNPDKHRAPQLGVLGLHEGGIKVANTSEDPFFTTLKYSGIKDGAVVAGLRFHNPEPFVNVDLDLTFLIVFSEESKPWRGTMPILIDIRQEVCRLTNELGVYL